MKDEKLFIDPIVTTQLDRISRDVKKKDKDWVCVFDGEEGSGKSVLAMQVAKYLDPNFNIDNVVFNADQFIERLKTAPPHSCILLDEAYNSANSRSVLTQVNRAMVSVATEMRQRNLFVIFVLPTFFDLDKYFAIWRCRTLFHVYFDKETGDRGQYIIFPKTAKKILFLTGKKFYNYSKPRSPYPACKFRKYYVINEEEYRLKKAEAFRKRSVSNMAKRWKDQRDCFIKELYHNMNITSGNIVKVMENWEIKPLSTREISRIVQIQEAEEDERGT